MSFLWFLCFSKQFFHKNGLKDPSIPFLHIIKLRLPHLVQHLVSSEQVEQDQIVNKVNRINRELSHTNDRFPIVSVSAGVAYGANENSWKSLFNHADQAMYQIKQSGGRGCRFYSP